MHIFFFIYSTDIYYVPGRSQILSLLQRTAQIMTLFILSLNFSKGVGWNNYTEIYTFQVLIGSMVYRKQGDVIKIKSAGYLRAQQILCDCGMESRFRILETTAKGEAEQSLWLEEQREDCWAEWPMGKRSGEGTQTIQAVIRRLDLTLNTKGRPLRGLIKGVTWSNSFKRLFSYSMENGLWWGKE